MKNGKLKKEEEEEMGKRTFDYAGKKKEEEK